MAAAKQTGEAKRILCIGMPVRDLIYRIKALPERGEKVRAEHFVELAGGNALNASIGIARLGGRVLFSGPTGDAAETTSAYIFEQVAKEGIAANVVHVPGTVTPISNVMIDPSGERTVVTFRDPNLWNVTLPDTGTLLDGCDAVLTENRCASFVTDLCVEASRRGIPVVLDADVVMSPREGLLAASSHIIFSTEALTATRRHLRPRSSLAANRRADFIVRRRDPGRPGHDLARRERSRPKHADLPGPHRRYPGRRGRVPRRLRAGHRRGHDHPGRHAVRGGGRRPQMHPVRRGLRRPDPAGGRGLVGAKTPNGLRKSQHTVEYILEIRTLIDCKRMIFSVERILKF